VLTLNTAHYLLHPKNCIYTAVLLCALQIPSALAESSPENWYQIEYVIFEHLKSDRHVLRFESTPYSLPEREQYSYLINRPESLSPFHLQLLDPDSTELKDALSHLSRNAEVRVYDSGAWQQAISRDQALPPIKIHRDMSHVGGQVMTGEIQITRGRYLHSTVDLYLSDFMTLPYTDLKNWVFQDANIAWPLDWLLHPLSFDHPSLRAVGEAQIAQNVIHLAQSRRIKDGEVHYIDHPALGLIITIKEIEPPFEFGSDSEVESYSEENDSNQNHSSQN